MPLAPEPSPPARRAACSRTHRRATCSPPCARPLPPSSLRPMAGERLTLDEVVAIDVHTHVEMSQSGHDSLPDELRDAALKHFRGEMVRPTAPEVADHYRARKMMAVVFTVDSESVTGQKPVPNDEVIAGARENDDVLIPFASIDPHRGSDGVEEARRLIAEGGVRGFKFHPNLQGFFPNDRIAYPLYEVIQEAGLPALFHTGHSGIGSGLP